MNRTMMRVGTWAVASGTAGLLAACGGGGGSKTEQPPSPMPASFVGTNGVFAAVADPSSGNAVFVAAQIAGKRQYLRGTVDLFTGLDTGLPAGAEVYKAADGHIYGVDLVATGAPAPVQLSSESLATVDDACTFGGASLPGVSSDYTGVFAAADFAHPANYSYFYRLAGPDGVCNSADDVIHLVRTAMGSADAPLVAAAMPAATIYDQTGAIQGFIAKMGASLVLLDGNGQNPLALATFAAPIAVAIPLNLMTGPGRPTGSLFVVDGNIVYVDYLQGTVSPPLFAIPGWTAQSTLNYSATQTTIYFSIFTPASGTTPASSALYSMPGDGSAAPTLFDTEAGRVLTVNVPAQSNRLVFSVSQGNPASFTIRTMVEGSGVISTLLSAPQNTGRFVATDGAVYYTAFQAVSANGGATVTRSGITSGIVGTDGTVIQAPLASSEFLEGGQEFPVSTSGPLWINPALSTVFQLTNLATTVNATTPLGVATTTPGLAEAQLVAIDTGTYQVVATIGTLPVSNATYLVDTFFGLDNVAFIDATNDASTANPGTRDLYLVDTHLNSSLQRLTNNL